MQHDAQLAGILGRAHLLANVGHGDDRVRLALTREFLEQVRTHILTVVGNRIIHRQRAQGRNARTVTASLARKRHTATVLDLGILEPRHLLTGNARVERLKKAHFLQSLLESHGIVAILPDDEFGHTDVRRRLNDLSRSARSTAMRIGNGITSGIGP